MKHMIRLTDHTATDIMDIFHIADEIRQGNYANILKGKSIVMFFPETSIRTRVTFEKGISLLGGQPILFPPEALDKKRRCRMSAAISVFGPTPLSSGTRISAS